MRRFFTPHRLRLGTDCLLNTVKGGLFILFLLALSGLGQILTGTM